MTITGVSYTLIPSTTLTLNLVVTFIGMVNYWRNGHGRIDLVGPFLLTSIPMAYFAGSLIIPETIFQIILVFTLLLVSVRIYFFDGLTLAIQLSPVQKWILIILMGGILGFIAGAVGIGGGIYLVPLIILFGLGSTKEAAAAGAMFIWANSLVGIIARYKSGAFDAEFILPLIIAVLIGGSVGSYFGSEKFEPKTIQKIMGLIIIVAILFLIKDLLA